MSIQHPSRLQRAASFGFSLIELMIVVAIVAILAAIALPSYTSYVVKTRRAAATACLSQYAGYMERYYTTNLSYLQDTESTPVPNPISTTPATLEDCASTSQTGNNYTYSASGVTATTYILTATPIGAQLASDTQCGALTLDQTGTRGSSVATNLALCWGG